MRQFLILAWKGKQPFVRVAAPTAEPISAGDGTFWAPLQDPPRLYDELRAEYVGLTASGQNENFDEVELITLDDVRACRKLVTAEAAAARKAAQEAANAKHLEKQLEEKKAADEKDLAAANAEAARKKATLADHNAALAKLRASKVAPVPSTATVASALADPSTPEPGSDPEPDQPKRGRRR